MARSKQELSFLDRLFLKDSRDLLSVLPKTPVVDTTITSPPYWNLKNYGSVEGQIGFGQKKDQYLADVKVVLENCFAVTKETGSLWLVADDYSEKGVLQMLPWEIAERARSVGWILRDLIVWDKQHSLPWQTNSRMRNVSEFIMVFSKSDKYKYYVDRIKSWEELSRWWLDFPERFSPLGKTPSNIWTIPFRTKGAWRKPSKIDHHCSFPTELVARILDLTTDPGDVVMDPFAGSSVVLAQSAAMGRRYVGFEINPEYVTMFETTVRAEVLAEWQHIQKERKERPELNGGFEKTIMGLRALKYARMVSKSFLENQDGLQPTEIKAVICLADIPKSYKRKHPFKVNVQIVMEHANAAAKLALIKARKRALKPPLSQYEIDGAIDVVNLADLLADTSLAKKKLYLYPNYKPRGFTDSDSLSRWIADRRLDRLAEANQKKIPLLSNVQIDLSWAAETA